MASDVLQKEIVGMSEADINLLIEYARYLKYRVSIPANNVSASTSKRKIGFLADAFVSISPDFDETPDCMKEYV